MRIIRACSRPSSTLFSLVSLISLASFFHVGEFYASASAQSSSIENSASYSSDGGSADEVGSSPTESHSLARTSSGPKSSSRVVSRSVSTAPTMRGLISEFRSRGPNGSEDEYIEIYNPSRDAVDCSGWQVRYGTDGYETIPNGTVLPPFGHFLFTGWDYSLSSVADPDLNITNPLGDGDGIELCTASGTRLDAVSFANSSVVGEGNPITSAPTQDAEFAFARKISTTDGLIVDTDNNANDFWLVSTSGAQLGGTSGTAQPALGAPGPQNTSSPVFLWSNTLIAPLDPSVASSVSPNRVRDTTPGVGPTAYGTLSVRRRFTNTSRFPIKFLRIRISNLTTLNSSGYTNTAQADCRIVSSINKPQSLTVGGSNISLEGTTLDTRISQPLGGGLNSTLDCPLSTPLAPGESRYYDLTMGLVRTGNFSVNYVVEGVADPSTISDAQIRVAPEEGMTEEALFSGQNIYNTTGEGQDAAILSAPGQTSTFYVKVENDGPETAALRVTLPSLPVGWTAKVFDEELDGNDITTQVLQSSGWQTSPMTPNQSRILRVEVTSSPTTQASGSILLNVSGGLSTDTVRAIVQLQRVGGAEYSVDGGQTWHSVSAGTPIMVAQLGTVTLRALKADPSLDWPADVTLPAWNYDSAQYVGDTVCLYFPMPTTGQNKISTATCGASSFSVEIQVAPSTPAPE